MQDLPKTTYDNLSIEIRDVRYTYIPQREGYCIVISSEESSEFVYLLENANELLSESVFRDISPDSRDMYDCVMCESDGCDVRYNATELTLHSGECKEQFVTRIRSFLIENSQTVLNEVI
jgi:hypothetical protein